MVDVSNIPPMTEAQADALFNQPSALEAYEAAMCDVRTCVGLPEAEAIARYVNLLRLRLKQANANTHSAEMRLQGIRDNY